MHESPADIEFFFDPVCPFAWITSRWITKVVAQTGYSVDWRFISLRLINRDKDYATHFPPDYPRLHGAGLRMLRVAAAARAERGRAAVGPLYTQYGVSIWDRPPPDVLGVRADAASLEHLHEALAAAGLPAVLADAAEDGSWDEELLAESEDALSRTGRDVGTPIITFRPPDGPSFFGPVISRIPADEDAVRLWNAVIDLATFPGFAELKRSLRERIALRAVGGDGLDATAREDWHGGRRAD